MASPCLGLESKRLLCKQPRPFHNPGYADKAFTGATHVKSRYSIPFASGCAASLSVVLIVMLEAQSYVQKLYPAWLGNLHQWEGTHARAASVLEMKPVRDYSSSRFSQTLPVAACMKCSITAVASAARALQECKCSEHRYTDCVHLSSTGLPYACPCCCCGAKLSLASC